MESLERLPFSEPYFSTTSKHDPIPFELSTYHKHCIRQEKYIDQKQFHSQSTSIHSDLTNDRSQKPVSTIVFHSAAYMPIERVNIVLRESFSRDLKNSLKDYLHPDSQSNSTLKYILSPREANK